MNSGRPDPRGGSATGQDPIDVSVVASDRAPALSAVTRISSDRPGAIAPGMGGTLETPTP
ncbi:protein of unknown function [Modestobacter italicus]|uniref:Uncharacterized protein n=1 Tax=Modestobacter italicus (strain DSM 44449 / CECT 9708 / BC 501) TaxID=2732864 RepID=I4F0J9_MODI5|nr:protein of unknown function [Modestobacter marinus]